MKPEGSHQFHSRLRTGGPQLAAQVARTLWTSTAARGAVCFPNAPGSSACDRTAPPGPISVIAPALVLPVRSWGTLQMRRHGNDQRASYERTREPRVGRQSGRRDVVPGGAHICSMTSVLLQPPSPCPDRPVAPDCALCVNSTQVLVDARLRVCYYCVCEQAFSAHVPNYSPTPKAPQAGPGFAP